METFQRLWRNEYFKTAITIILIIAIVFGFWLGFQAALGTEYPALAVASWSMEPTLNVGDLIIVQHVDPTQLNASRTTGDIVVFKEISENGKLIKLIVHRVVKVENKSGNYEITIQGDNNEGPDFPRSASLLVGKVIAKIPYIGNIALLIHAQENMYLFIVLIIFLIIIFLMLPFGTSEEEVEKEQNHKKRKLFGKIDVKIIYISILNVLLIGFAVFSLWGSFTFFQPGSGPPPDYVTIYGMYSDLQFHESFKYQYNDVNGTLLSQGFLTYKIDDCLRDGSVRQGVPTFSWFQFSVLVLCIVDVWTLFDFWNRRKTEIEQQEVLSEPKAL
ncbi:signal peptidase I [Candidatus Bathyarchaeota archaeon]|nr:MAG: signal peptidase I [Candidatus Bathyarchaeota archaeon]